MMKINQLSRYIYMRTLEAVYVYAGLQRTCVITNRTTEKKRGLKRSVINLQYHQKINKSVFVVQRAVVYVYDGLQRTCVISNTPILKSLWRKQNIANKCKNKTSNFTSVFKVFKRKFQVLHQLTSGIRSSFGRESVVFDKVRTKFEHERFCGRIKRFVRMPVFFLEFHAFLKASVVNVVYSGHATHF